MSWLLLALQVILSVVLLVAATEKTLRAEEFFAALRLSHLPAGSIAPIGVAVPALELTLALALLLAPAQWLPLAFVAAALVLGAFTAWMGWVRARRLRVRCGCFGPGGGHVGPRTIGRNFLLLALALGGLVLAGQTRYPAAGSLAGDGRHRDVPRRLPRAPARAARRLAAPDPQLRAISGAPGGRGRRGAKVNGCRHSSTSRTPRSGCCC